MDDFPPLSLESSIDSTALEPLPKQSNGFEDHSTLHPKKALASAVDEDKQARPRSVTQSSVKNPKVKTEFQLTRKSAPRSLSFSNSLDDSTRVPLLEEDKL